MIKFTGKERLCRVALKEITPATEMRVSYENSNCLVLEDVSKKIKKVACSKRSDDGVVNGTEAGFFWIELDAPLALKGRDRPNAI